MDFAIESSGIFSNRSVLNGKITCSFDRKNLISLLNTCKLKKSYLLGLIFQKQFIISAIQIYPWLSSIMKLAEKVSDKWSQISINFEKIEPKIARGMISSRVMMRITILYISQKNFCNFLFTHFELPLFCS